MDGLNPSNLAFAEELYLVYLKDSSQVPPEWRARFDALEEAGERSVRLAPSFSPASIFRGGQRNGGPSTVQGTQAPARATPAETPADAREAARLQDRVDQLVRAFRVRGHMVAQLDPLGLPRPEPPELEPSFYGLTEDDLERPFSSVTIQGPDVLPLSGMLDRLRSTYCRYIGVQFMHIDDLMVKTWLQTRMEGSQNRIELAREEQIRILTRLTDAVIFEEFIQKRFQGAKSFSLEGGESLIPLLDLAIERAGEQGLSEVVLAMSHRGRLNVLANILGKSPSAIFREFEDADPELSLGRGDVKYHLGHSSDYETQAGKRLHLSLCFNPSHLGFVGPVALGRVRAKQDRAGEVDGSGRLAILIHGDAAFAGEGITQETLNLSELGAYRTGGTIHIIVNNQVGFTTRPEDGRSSPYATDVAKMLQIPIFHVNGEDPEAVAQVMHLAMDFRLTFQRDVVIDMYCYRRRGHNEGDEPRFTQPEMYQAIDQRKSVRDGYLEHLLTLGEVTHDEADEIGARRREHLETELAAAKSDEYQVVSADTMGGVWSGFVGGYDIEVEEPETGLEAAKLAELFERLTTVPAGFSPNPKLSKILEGRAEMGRGERVLDWSAGEAAAIASLASEGHRVRLTGQDCERGTFSHRHAVWHDLTNGQRHEIFQHIREGQGPVQIHNSPLSEAGVLGFEYGYSLDWPDALVMWEAQFGDFCNAAQVIIDQFLVSAEEKWRRLSGLTLLLPHGFEGMGPEHSSARLERFLMLAAEDNIQVANPTTPAQQFHLLRRQVHRRLRKPLIVMSPKSLLRHPRATSPLEVLTAGGFRRVLPDRRGKPRGRTSRVLVCSGKIYYDLEAERERLGRSDVAILRMEQLYPVPEQQLRLAIEPYPARIPIFWVQEEPMNMGAWSFLRHRIGDRLFGSHPFSAITRPESASPATGSHASHRLEQDALLAESFGTV